ncbi:hypothetical protein KJ815_01315 [bacterium]|nr:hypothetical protein [bacterium]
MLCCAVPSAQAHQLVLTTGYANSRTPETGTEIDVHNPPFRAGGGYAVGIRIDVEPPTRPIMFGPSFLFWNNLTGDPDPYADASYFQIELGGRLSARTRTLPTLYTGIGAGYTVSHGEKVAKLDGMKETFDGSFPTGSFHFGVKSHNQSGLSIVAEGSYHLGLDKPRGRQAIGPASAWLVQIGIGLDLLVGSARP